MRRDGTLVCLRRHQSRAIRVPLGLTISKGDSIEIQKQAGRETVYWLRGEDRAILSPSFRILLRRGILISQATSLVEKRQCMGLIDRVHYLPAPNSGIFLMAKS